MSDEEREPTMSAGEALNIWNGLIKRYGAFVKDVPRVLGAAVAVEEAIREEEARRAELHRQNTGLEATIATRLAATDQKCAEKEAVAQANVERLKGDGTLLAGDNDRLRGENAELRAQKTKLTEDVKRLTVMVTTLEANA